jgi:hypothetical protein
MNAYVNNICISYTKFCVSDRVYIFPQKQVDPRECACGERMCRFAQPLS